ncbi:hypothetical protein JG687_00003312 [Phytophthora cactorum]|uniref:PX domain-containing protein n=1 Tax=Phytophthora cactorum TaxID=29920 RepID=A0A8T1USZ4_9STRA|nr:hypothetical protein JG687_00003312 [Phytophthora cactorum]
MESTTTDAAVTQQYGNETWTLPQQPALDLGVHRHWKAAASVKFLSSVAHIDDIHETREDKQRTVFYRLDIYLRHPTTPSVSSSNVLRSPDSEIERSFSDFEALRGAVFDAASIMPQCRCKYCMEVLLYIRYKFDRPRSIVKFVAGTEKRKQIFAQFINDSVEMGRRRVQKAGKFECKAQTPPDVSSSKIVVMESMTAEVGCLEPLAPAVVTHSGAVVEATPIPPPLEPESQQRLNQDAHRRWRASTSVEFLNKVNSIDILKTRTEDRAVLYVLEVRLGRPPDLKVERRFTDFEELRQGIQSAVSVLPPCTCQYCLDLLVYVRFNMAQPRGFVKLTAGTEKRKKILAQFIGDMVAMGRRRVEKVSQRECKAQLLIPVMLEDFLLG